MKPIIADHDGKRYLLISIFSSNPDADVAALCAVPISPAAVLNWRINRNGLASLQFSHPAIDSVTAKDDSPLWIHHDEEQDPLDEDRRIYPPVFEADDDTLRTEIDRAEFDDSGITFFCFVRNTDIRLTAWVEWSTVEALPEATS